MSASQPPKKLSQFKIKSCILLAALQKKKNNNSRCKPTSWINILGGEEKWKTVVPSCSAAPASAESSQNVVKGRIEFSSLVQPTTTVSVAFWEN